MWQRLTGLTMVAQRETDRVSPCWGTLGTCHSIPSYSLDGSLYHSWSENPNQRIKTDRCLSFLQRAKTHLSLICVHFTLYVKVEMLITFEKPPEKQPWQDPPWGRWDAEAQWEDWDRLTPWQASNWQFRRIGLHLYFQELASPGRSVTRKTNQPIKEQTIQASRLKALKWMGDPIPQQGAVKGMIDF